MGKRKNSVGGKRIQSHGKGLSPKRKHSRKAGSASVNGWERAEDIPQDEEDMFHAHRDRILLEGDDLSEDDDGLGDEDEVFALNGVSDEDSDLEDEQDEDVDEDDDEDEDEVEPLKQSSKSTKSSSKPIPIGSDDDDDDDEKDSEDEQDLHWGSKRSTYYSSNAAELDSDDEEGNELEEKEVKRLQIKTREALHEDDYGLVDLVVEDETENNEKDVWDDREEPKSATSTVQKKSKEELIRQLEIQSPETLALARDWEDVISSIQSVEQALKLRSPDDPALGLMHVHYQTLLTYATTLAFYLHLRSSTHYANHPELLRKHPIMKRLVELKRGVVELEGLGFAADGADEESEDDLEDEGFDVPDWGDHFGIAGPKNRKLEKGELEALLQDVLMRLDGPERDQPGGKAVQEQPKLKKKKVVQETRKPEVVFDLVEPEFVSTSKKPKARDLPANGTTGHADDYGFGDPTLLQHSDIADKAARKKSLRFHTARIEGAHQRRQNARNAIGGDDDIPYKERRKESEMKRALREKRGMGGDDLEVDAKVGTDELKRKRKSEEDDASDADVDADGYYELVKRRKQEKKGAKKLAHEAALEAARIDYDGLNRVDGDHRSLTREILKNRGLTARRSKSVRNPRVKKKLQFEKAKKKVASKRAVWKGGLQETGGKYMGEKSGISKVVKSVKLS
ncbi:hypothetical protein FRC02_000366 [Tulasnella sp. 418]|nr:hypothetical protein FRC02_000366 [Tulasnella sp. 418]